MKCPTCRRTLVEKPDACPRCNTDLRSLHLIRGNAEHYLVKGRTLLREEHFNEARRCFQTARRLMATPESARGLALAALLQGDFAEALIWRHKARKEG